MLVTLLKQLSSAWGKWLLTFTLTNKIITPNEQTVHEYVEDNLSVQMIV